MLVRSWTSLWLPIPLVSSVYESFFTYSNLVFLHLITGSAKASLIYSMSNPADVVITTLTSIFLMTTIVGNLLICAIVFRNRDMR